MFFSNISHTIKIYNEFSILVKSAIIIILLCYLQWHWNRRTLYKYASKFKGPLCLPFVGNAFLIPKIAKDFFDGVPKLFQKYGNPMRIWMGPRLCVITNDANDAALILNNPSCLDRNDDLNSVEVLGNGLVTGPAWIWKTHRKLIQPTMRQQIVDTFVETFAEQSNILTEKLLEDVGKNCDIFDKIFKSSMDSICETTMGLNMNNQSKENMYGRELQRYLDIVFTRMYTFWQLPDIIFKLTGNYGALKKTAFELNQFADNIIKTRREECRIRKFAQPGCEDNINRNMSSRKKTFMELLLDISENDTNFTDKDIRDETATMIAGGSDTTALTDCFVLTCLALYPDIQEKVYEEVMEQLGPDRLVEKGDLTEFKYLEQVIKETLRMFPIFPLLTRECRNDVKLTNNVVIPRGSMAIIVVHPIHHDVKDWEAPTKFNPDRFLPENIEKRGKYAYMAFGIGPRNCIGQKYAMSSMKTTIALLVRKYKFYTDYKSIEDIILKLEGSITKPKDGFKIRLIERC